MRRQLHIFLTAVMFYTRLPCPAWVNHDEAYLNKATVYFPVIGWLVGVFAGLVWWVASLVFPPPIAVLFSMVGTVLLTGAFHEDGLADVCDGFGGGWTKLKILEIMKDSRVGTYGVVGLGLLMATKFFALLSLVASAPTAVWVLVIFVLAHTLSRTTALTLIYTNEYARENEDSKAKPVAKQLTATEFAVALALGLLPLGLAVVWQYPWQLALVVLPLWALRAYLARYFVRWIGGYTGDCLGATQQLAEVMIYLFLLALPKLT